MALADPEAVLTGGGQGRGPFRALKPMGVQMCSMERVQLVSAGACVQGPQTNDGPGGCAGGSVGRDAEGQRAEDAGVEHAGCSTTAVLGPSQPS